MTKEEREVMRNALSALIDLGAEDYQYFEDVLNDIEKCLANDALEKKAENARELGLDYD